MGNREEGRGDQGVIEKKDEVIEKKGEEIRENQEMLNKFIAALEENPENSLQITELLGECKKRIHCSEGPSSPTRPLSSKRECLESISSVHEGDTNESTCIRRRNDCEE